MMKSICSMGLVLTLAATGWAQAQDTSAPVKFTKPVLKKSANPRYPIDRYKESGESSIDDGLVELVYMVGPDGKAGEVMVARASMQRFIEPALTALSKYEYQPAKSGNKTVASRASTTMVFKYNAIAANNIRGSNASFTDLRDEGLPEGYDSFYNRFSKEINEPSPDQDKLQFYIDRMAEFKHQTFYSLSYLSLARFHFAEKFLDAHAQIEAIEDLIWFDERVKEKFKILQPDTLQTIRATLLRLQLGAGYYQQALTNFQRFAAENAQIGSMFSEYFDRLAKLKEGEDAAQAAMQLNDQGALLYPLLKPSFGLSNVVGEVSSIAIRCDARFAKLDYEEEMQYEIPASWGDCDLQVNGSAGTTFDVYQQ